MPMERANGRRTVLLAVSCKPCRHLRVQQWPGMERTAWGLPLPARSPPALSGTDKGSLPRFLSLPWLAGSGSPLVPALPLSTGGVERKIF